MPQAPFGQLVDAKRDGSDLRRVDFLFAAPWLAQRFVVEIDGSHHPSEHELDKARDRQLEMACIAVERITTDVLHTNEFVALEKFRSRWREPVATNARHASLLYAPVQVHRFVLAIADALGAGLLTGDRWAIAVDDPLGLTAELARPYFAVLGALDTLWAGQVMPGEIVLDDGTECTLLVRAGIGYEPAGRTERCTPDLVVDLEPGKSATDVLPTSSGPPRIVVRSAYLGASIKEPGYRVPSDRPCARGTRQSSLPSGSCCARCSPRMTSVRGSSMRSWRSSRGGTAPYFSRQGPERA